MIVTLKRHLVYKKVTKIYRYIYVITKNYGSCKILIARYYYIKSEVLTLYTFLGNKIQNHFCYC